MRYLFILSFFLISCIKEEDVDELLEGFLPTVYELKLRYDGDRLTFTQISLPNEVFNVTSNNQSFEYATYNRNDISVKLIYDCETGNQKNLNKDVSVNFYEDKITVLEISKVTVCDPEVKVLYEDK